MRKGAEKEKMFSSIERYHFIHKTGSYLMGLNYSLYDCTVLKWQDKKLRADDGFPYML